MVTSRPSRRRGASRRASHEPVPRRFYEQALTEAESRDLESARAIEGLDDEVALLRLRLRSVLSRRPDDLTLMFKGVELLTKAVSARYRMSKGERNEVSQSLRELITSMQGAVEEVADV